MPTSTQQPFVVALGTYLGATCKESFRRIYEAIPTVNAPTGQLKEDSSMNKNIFAPALDYGWLIDDFAALCQRSELSGIRHDV